MPPMKAAAPMPSPAPPLPLPLPNTNGPEWVVAAWARAVAGAASQIAISERPETNNGASGTLRIGNLQSDQTRGDVAGQNAPDGGAGSRELAVAGDEAAQDRSTLAIVVALAGGLGGGARI